MATLNVLLPGSDHLREFIQEDIRKQEYDIKLLANYLHYLSETPVEQFVSVTAGDVKARARKSF